ARPGIEKLAGLAATTFFQRPLVCGIAQFHNFLSLPRGPLPPRNNRVTGRSRGARRLPREGSRPARGTMSAIVTIKAEPRTGSGSRASYKLRKAGRVPGIVYGHKLANVQVAVSAEELDRAIRVQHARVLDLEIDGKPETVLIRELQWDHLGKTMLHVDFARVSASDKVKVTVPVELRGAPRATGGGVLDQPLHTLHVECSPTEIPETIRVDISNL